MAWATQISRVLSLAAAVVVLFIELQGSAAMRATLVGARGPLRASSNYTSSLMPLVAAALMANRSLHVHGPVPRLLYIDADDSQEGYGFSASQCASPLPGDRIYASSYLGQLLPRVLAAAPGVPEPATILIDCTFTARVVQDTTALKVHWLDANATSLSTLFLQTMVLKRPTKRLSMACGVATLTSLALASSAAVSASYVHGVGLDFPYVLSAFTPLELAPTLTLDGMWQGTLGGSAGETIHVAGTEGIYRVAHSTQANYDHYIWALPNNPFEFVELVSYLTTDMSKDSFAWVRMLLSMGVGLTLLVHFAVALVVALHMYRAHRVLWVPDVFPCVQTRLQLRALLCLLVLACTNGWHLYEYALCTANAREGWTNSFVLTDIIRADALMVYLGLMITLANAVRIRLRLEVAVSIYVICYQLSDDIVATHGLALDATNAYVKANYLANILEAHVDGMDLWTSHENFSTNGAVVATQMTWWVVASCLCCGYALAAKGCNMVDMDRRRCMTWRHMHHMRLRSEDVVHTFATQSASRRRRSSLSKVGPVGPVRKTFSFQDVSSVAVEAVLHTQLCQVYGLVAPLDEFVAVSGWSYVSASSVWLLGYVLVDGVFLVHVNDYPLLMLNALLRRWVFRVYGFHVIDATIHAEKTRLLPNAIPIRHLLRTTVCELR
ncbi:hypothetical protein SPRG_06537 [Saprolegnia parasitica CBS 223.65]|uniref:Ig-like domain-containing protein n=1 Tax=Saprolegnia parasitica (strain CBS 223.65) TaxID=695850 RepID=A0A067CE01_SAPPC|nr:hypothetical protein SPRG_06537 [Saprolegnia parasitica CBS 223.65]KDO28683.1 hypothetical protein SPRG_06537 [Saprolegnia parasitica CBS 223.65]|eukprot:XP_012200742.1 hypothetical protein SPRG_06537 [Saprolegnia parasitica CBS 223.65]